MVMPKNDVKYVGGISDKVNGDKIIKPNLSEFMIWEILKDVYAKPFFEKSSKKQHRKLASLDGSKVLVSYFMDPAIMKYDPSELMYLGFDFARGIFQESGKGIVLKVNGEKTFKIVSDNIRYIVPVKSLESFDEQPLLQFTFNSGLTSDRNSFYLRDVVDTNPFTAANNLLDVLSLESNLHIPVRLNQIQMPEQGYVKQLEETYAKKGIFIFEKNKPSKYDNF